MRRRPFVAFAVTGMLLASVAISLANQPAVQTVSMTEAYTVASGNTNPGGGGSTFGSCGKPACTVSWSTCSFVAKVGSYYVDIPNSAKQCDWGLTGCDNHGSTTCEWKAGCSDSACTVGCGTGSKPAVTCP